MHGLQQARLLEPLRPAPGKVHGSGREQRLVQVWQRRAQEKGGSGSRDCRGTCGSSFCFCFCIWIPEWDSIEEGEAAQESGRDGLGEEYGDAGAWAGTQGGERSALALRLYPSEHTQSL